MNTTKKTLESLREWEELEKQCAEQIKAIKNTIKADMEELHTDTLAIDKYVCKISTCSRTDIDRKALQSEMPEVFGKYAKVSTYTKFTVTG